MSKPKEIKPPKFVPTERLTPLVEWLERLYGSMSDVSRVTGIPHNTLSNIKYATNKRTTRENALKIVQVVQQHRHGDRTHSLYENEAPPRYATKSELDAIEGVKRWRSAGAPGKRGVKW